MLGEISGRPTVIGLDARTIYAPHRRGTGKNLIDAYRALVRHRPHWQFIMYHRGQSLEDPFSGNDNVRQRIINMPGDRLNLWEEIRFPSACVSDGVDLMHCPANSCPRVACVPLVATVHDLIPLRISDPLTDPHRTRFEKRVRRCVQQATRVVAVSHNTKNDLISDFSADAHKVDVITWAPDHACHIVREPGQLEGVRARYNIKDRYLLAFSGRSIRKNAHGMIRAYARTPELLRRQVQFVIIGVSDATLRQQLSDLATELGVDGRCMVYGFAPEQDIAPLLSGADALAFCSLYEGFGLPILDAFLCECAVLTSNTSSMPEVAGDAALLCDPNDVGSMSEGMSSLLGDSELRSTLVAKGRQRVKQYTWERTAMQLAETFEKAVSMRCERV